MSLGWQLLRQALAAQGSQVCKVLVEFDYQAEVLLSLGCSDVRTGSSCREKYQGDGER